ncbi:MAG: T9SS type A sorting domain-containing protein [Ignavibacteriales bacterium]|nr:T9SS type A sorting domain-containing protein [Ignavibacteriales bacterium]
MKHLFSIILLLVVSFSLSFSQDFFPHAKGNKWVYKDFDSVGSTTGYLTLEIGRDTVMQNGKQYFHYPLLSSSTFSFARVDSNSLYFYNTTSGTEGRVFRFDTFYGARWLVPEVNEGFAVVGIDSVTMFLKKVKAISFITLSFPGRSYTFAESFGLTEKYVSFPREPSGKDYYKTSLQGCIINGVTYGDLTSVEKIESEVPKRMSLFPSYPNPFNGQTTVRFSLDRREYLRLAIYDILGREVAVLVEKELDAGVYNTQWIAGNLGSGVYLVRLQTAHNALAQKIIYMK